jgi:hypothetical protein
VLLVDDDDGAQLENYFAASLENNGYIFEIWDETADGYIGSSDIDGYTAVVWMTGVGGDIEPENITAIESLLDGGGNLLISGQDIGWQLNAYADPNDIAFYNDYLHAEYIYDDSGFRTLSGVPGDPIGDGLAFGIGAGDGSGSQEYPSEIDPGSGASAVLEYTAGSEGAIRYDTGHRLVYLAFGLEAVNTSADRDSLMRRCLGWLAQGTWPDTEPPAVTAVYPNGGEEFETGEEIELVWTAGDNEGVTSIDILLSTDGGASYTEVVAEGIANTGSHSWTVTEGESQDCKIRFIARDGAGLASFDDSDSEFVKGMSTGDPDTPEPGEYSLSQNVPNPFNPVTSIGFEVPRRSRVRIEVFDVSGRLTRRLADTVYDAGRHEVIWDGADGEGGDAASGIYFCRMIAPGFSSTTKMVLLR